MKKTARVSLQISSRHKQDLLNSRVKDLLKQRAELRATKIIRARNKTPSCVKFAPTPRARAKNYNVYGEPKTADKQLDFFRIFFKYTRFFSNLPKDTDLARTF